MLSEGLLFAGRYQFIKQLGRGGFSEVWLANDTVTNIQVAVKVYAPGTGLDEAGIKLFTQEFSLVFDMNHTNLLRPTHFDSWERMPYLIMPLCKNGSAFKYVISEERITEHQCWQLLHDVAAGLAYLHEKNPPVIHQDIKPDNILISDEGTYMITDFGISARVRSTIRAEQAMEQSAGTLAYMGPERFSATPKPIMASDIWSLGAMMYELMTKGNPPFGSHGGVLQKNGADIPTIAEDYSQDIKDIVYKCLSKETWDRPTARSIEEIAYNKLHGLPSATQSSKGQEDNLMKDLHNLPPKSHNFVNKKAIAGILVVIVSILGLVFFFKGGKDIGPIEPSINWDSIRNVANSNLLMAQRFKINGDALLIKFADNKINTDSGLIETSYIESLSYLSEVESMKYRDSLPDIITIVLQTKQSAIDSLLMLYRELEGTEETMLSLGQVETADQCRERMETIASYIPDYIENVDEIE